MGKTKNDGFFDAYPIQLSGMADPVWSYRVEEYVNAEFIYYYNFYLSCKNAGLPFQCGWPDMPPWVVQLMTAFNGVIEREKLHNEHKFMAQLHGYKVP